MTMAQLQAHGAPNVLKRLMALKQHLLALRIATALGLNPEQVSLLHAPRKYALSTYTVVVIVFHGQLVVGEPHHAYKQTFCQTYISSYEFRLKAGIM